MTLNKALSFLILLFYPIIFSSCNQARSEYRDSASGRAVKIIDGDTYDILIDGVQTRVRMYGIDAPERGQDYYKISKEYLGQLCQGELIRLSIKNKDRYGRTVARSYLSDGRELGAEMIKAGLAWHFKKYSSDADLANYELKARDAHIGIWSMSQPIAPWDFRKIKNK